MGTELRSLSRGPVAPGFNSMNEATSPKGTSRPATRQEASEAEIAAVEGWLIGNSGMQCRGAW
jgi:hypothetical protein